MIANFLSLASSYARIQFTLILIGAANCAAATTPSYEAITIPTVVGSTAMIPSGLNATGQVVGNARFGTLSLGFIFDGATLQTVSPPVGYSSSVLTAISNSGLVTGHWYAGPISAMAFVKSGASITNLGFLGSFPVSYSADINVGGVAVGTSYVGLEPRGYVTSGTGLRDLGALPGYRYSEATAINDSSQVLLNGFESDAASMRTWISSAGSNFVIPLLPGQTSSRGSGMNEFGNVTGSSGNRSFLWKSGAIQDLGMLDSLINTNAAALNNQDWIVGESYNSLTRSAFLYAEGTLYDLNNLVVSGLGSSRLVSATGINDFGQIVAVGDNGSAYLLSLTTPIPEPSVQAMLTSGILFLAFLVSRRRAT